MNSRAQRSSQLRAGKGWGSNWSEYGRGGSGAGHQPSAGATVQAAEPDRSLKHRDTAQRGVGGKVQTDGHGSHLAAAIPMRVDGSGQRHGRALASIWVGGEGVLNPLRPSRASRRSCLSAPPCRPNHGCRRRARGMRHVSEDAKSQTGAGVPLRTCRSIEEGSSLA